MAEVLTLPGVKGSFAVGLSWRHEDDAPKGKALRQLASQFGQWGTVFTAHGRGVQVGFCDPLRDIKSPGNLKALAATIANQYPQPWRGVFKLNENRYWYVAVRDGQEILPDGDRIGTFDEIQAILADHERHGNWKDYELSTQELVDIVQGHSRFHKLKDLGFDPTLRYTGIAAGIAVLWIAAGAGLFFHNRHQQEAIAARMAAVRARGAADHAASEQRANQRVWEVLPKAKEILAVCREQWAKQPLAQLGWVLANWNCSADSRGITVESDWNREGGLASNAPGRLKPDGDHSSDSRVAHVTWQSYSDEADSSGQSARKIWTLAQTYGLRLKLEQNAGASIIVDSEGKQIPRPWSQVGAGFALVAPPWLVPGGAAFDRVPGLRLTKISLDAHNLSWSVEASLYSMRGPQPINIANTALGKSRVPYAVDSSVPQPIPVQPQAVPLPASRASANPTLPTRPAVEVDVHASAVPEVGKPSLPVEADGDTAAEADGSTIVVPVSTAPTQSTSSVSPTSNASMGMGALALAQQAQRAKHVQSSQPAVQSQPGAQTLSPPGLGE